MQIFLTIIHITLMVLNARLSIMYFKDREYVLGALWAITSTLWMVIVMTDIDSLLC